MKTPHTEPETLLTAGTKVPLSVFLNEKSTLAQRSISRPTHQFHLGQKAEGKSRRKSSDFLQHPSSDHRAGSLTRCRRFVSSDTRERAQRARAVRYRIGILCRLQQKLYYSTTKYFEKTGLSSVPLTVPKQGQVQWTSHSCRSFGGFGLESHERGYLLCDPI